MADNTKRRLAIQGVAALLQNAHFKGFFTGKIYDGPGKNVCVPGLNCYSCPGAVGSCPIGSLQTFLTGMRFRVPYYVVGLLLFFGALLGRVICGFLCPFGLLQELLHLIPVPKKLRTFKGDRILRYLKYVILVVFVIVLPIAVKLTPFFCKYICPSGTVSGILLALSDRAVASKLGRIFTWKLSLLVLCVLGSTVIFRPFCKYICPLGAIYGCFNKFALVRMECDHAKCISCGKCKAACKMCVDPVAAPNSAECIRCGDCIKACPVQALHKTIDKGELHGRTF
ncbi:MAG: 4Fe-4S binding protein [Lachnospiraceae bacterium]|nr:4Fe-4S binding protein [Lachnospiraceae bacterium]